MSTQMSFFQHTGVQCIKADGILPRVPAPEHGSATYVRRLCKAIVVCEKNPQSRCAERLANNIAKAY